MLLPQRIEQQLSESMDHVRKQLSGPVQTAFIGRPGMSLAPEGFEQTCEFSCTDIPSYPLRGDSGKHGAITEFRWRDSGVLVFSRRPHLYEGYEEWELGYPVHLAAALGVSKLLSFSAAGGLKGSYYRGLIVLIEDFINFAQVSPLKGLQDRTEGNRFPSMHQIAAPELVRLAQRAAEEVGERLSWGTYIMVRGPQFETPAELKMFASLGAELIGMSTVPELICAKAHGLRTLPLALITNLPLQTPASDQEVSSEVSGASGRICDLVNRIIHLLLGEVAHAG